MKCSDFQAWVNLCRDEGMTEREVAELLGCGVNSVTRWKRRDSPIYIGLAVAAIEARLDPWRKP